MVIENPRSEARETRERRGATAFAIEARPELSVIGFDDIPEAEARGLTTIRQDHREKGRRAAQIVLRGEQDSVTLPYELISRRSGRAPSA